MKHLSRVVWLEGMHLSPNHFQAQSRYFEEAIGFSVAAATPWSQGVTTCEFDEEALSNGTLRLLHARGVFPDGTPFDIPDQDEAPSTRAMNTLYDPTGFGMDICLALPSRRRGGNFSESPDSPVRFHSSSVRMPDETLGRGEAEVLMGRKRLALLTAREAQEQEGASGPRWTSLPVARVTRDASGRFILDASFVPAALRVRSSRRLVQVVEDLVSTLSERTAAMSRDYSPEGGRTRISQPDVMRFWFLHTLNTSIPRLKHLLDQNCHPSELYLELSRLAGGLCTFATKSSPASLPAFDSLGPGPAITALDAHIRRHLDIAFPVGSIRIPLKMVSNEFWEGKLEDSRLLAKGTWILGVRSSAGEGQVIGAGPQVIKVCSARYVSKLVDRGLPGMTLRHLLTPPPGCSPVRGYQYFAVDRTGPCWLDASTTQAVGIYVPETLPGVELELIALPE